MLLPTLLAFVVCFTSKISMPLLRLSGEGHQQARLTLHLLPPAPKTFTHYYHSLWVSKWLGVSKCDLLRDRRHKSSDLQCSSLAIYYCNQLPRKNKGNQTMDVF